MSRCETANGWKRQKGGGHNGVHESYSTGMLPIIFLFPGFLFFFLFKNPATGTNCQATGTAIVAGWRRSKATSGTSPLETLCTEPQLPGSTRARS